METEETISAEENERLEEITDTETAMRTAQIGERSRFILVTIGKLIDVGNTFYKITSASGNLDEAADDEAFFDLTVKMKDLLFKYLSLSIDESTVHDEIKEI